MDSKSIEDLIDKVLQSYRPRDDPEELVLKFYEILGSNFKSVLAVMDRNAIFRVTNKADTSEYFYFVEELDGTKFHIQKDFDYCSCRSFINNLTTNKGLQCKHILAIRIGLLLEKVKEYDLDLKPFLKSKLDFNFFSIQPKSDM